MRRLIAAIRENDEHKVEKAVLELARTRRIFAPLALAVGAFVMLFSGLRLLVTNWRLMLVQALPAMWIWAATFDLKAHVLHGKEFTIIRGPVVLVLFAAVVLITIAVFYLNAVFAFAITQPGPSDLRAGFHQARRHLKAVTGWGTGIGLALAIATILAPRWGLGWFSLLLGIVLAVMMVCYIAVPARIVGMRTTKPVKTAQSERGAKLAATAVTGLFGAIVCTPPYAIAQGGIALLSSSALFPLGVALLIIGLMLEAGATGAVRHQGERQAAGRPVPTDARGPGISRPERRRAQNRTEQPARLTGPARATPAALAKHLPPPLPPGWTKHPPLPPRTGPTPGWAQSRRVPARLSRPHRPDRRDARLADRSDRHRRPAACRHRSGVGLQGMGRPPQARSPQSAELCAPASRGLVWVPGSGQP